MVPLSPIKKHFALPSILYANYGSFLFIARYCTGPLSSRCHTEPNTQSKAVARKEYTVTPLFNNLLLLNLQKVSQKIK